MRPWLARPSRSALETAQYWFAPRCPSLIDLLTNTISAGAGAILGVVFAHRARHAFDSLTETVLGHPSSALFLGILWFATFFNPGRLGGPGAVQHIRAMLAAPHFAPGTSLSSFSQWLGLGALAAASSGGSARQRWLLWAGLATPLRFVVPGQRPELHEFLWAARLSASGMRLRSGKRLSTGMIAFLLASGLVWEELRPWHFSSHAGTFLWIPFRSMLAPPIGRRRCWCCSKIGRLRDNGLGDGPCRPRSAGSDSVRRPSAHRPGDGADFLPGRKPRQTDPILAVVLGVILLQFDRKFGADPGVGNALPEFRRSGHPQRATAGNIQAFGPAADGQGYEHCGAAREFEERKGFKRTRIPLFLRRTACGWNGSS